MKRIALVCVLAFAVGCETLGGVWRLGNECVENDLPGFYSLTCRRSGISGGKGTPFSFNVDARVTYIYELGTTKPIAASGFLNGLHQGSVVMGTGDPRELLVVCSDPLNYTPDTPGCD